MPLIAGTSYQTVLIWPEPRSSLPDACDLHRGTLVHAIMALDF